MKNPLNGIFTTFNRLEPSRLFRTYLLCLLRVQKHTYIRVYSKFEYFLYLCKVRVCFSLFFQIKFGKQIVLEKSTVPYHTVIMLKQLNSKLSPPIPTHAWNSLHLKYPSARIVSKYLTDPNAENFSNITGVEFILSLHRLERILIIGSTPR